MCLLCNKGDSGRFHGTEHKVRKSTVNKQKTIIGHNRKVSLSLFCCTGDTAKEMRCKPSEAESSQSLEVSEMQQESFGPETEQVPVTPHSPEDT